MVFYTIKWTLGIFHIKEKSSLDFLSDLFPKRIESKTGNTWDMGSVLTLPFRSLGPFVTSSTSPETVSVVPPSKNGNLSDKKETSRMNSAY